MIARLLAALALLGTAACTSEPAPAGPPCDTEKLIAWQQSGLAVLLRQFPDGTNDLAGMDVNSGAIPVACPLPPGWVTDQGLSYTLPMEQSGHPYKDTATRHEFFWRTQWFSPDFRWSVRPGRKSVLDVAANKIIDVQIDGDIVGVTSRNILIKQPTGWCLLPLPPESSHCTTLPPNPDPGAYVLNERGEPVWLTAHAREIPIGSAMAYVLTDGTRIYRAELFPATVSEKDNHRSAILDPTGLALFPHGPTHAPPSINWTDWFTLTPGPSLTIHHSLARDEDPVRNMLLTLGSRAVLLDGLSVVVASETRSEDRSITRFGLLTDNSPTTHTWVPTCQAHPCQILAWPNQPTPSTG